MGTSQTARLEADAAFVRHIRNSAFFRAAESVGLYLSDGTEVELEALLFAPEASSKHLLLPRYAAARKAYEFVEVRDPASELVIGRYGLREPRPELPAASPAIAGSMLCLVPGVAFDGAGNRLGRGGGFYDRLLSGVSGPVVGVAYGCQIAGAVPVEPHDRRMDALVTENGLAMIESER